MTLRPTLSRGLPFRGTYWGTFELSWHQQPYFDSALVNAGSCEEVWVEAVPPRASVPIVTISLPYRG